MKKVDLFGFELDDERVAAVGGLLAQGESGGGVALTDAAARGEVEDAVESLLQMCLLPVTEAGDIAFDLLLRGGGLLAKREGGLQSGAHKWWELGVLERKAKHEEQEAVDKQ